VLRSRHRREASRIHQRFQSSEAVDIVAIIRIPVIIIKTLFEARVLRENRRDHASALKRVDVNHALYATPSS